MFLMLTLLRNVKHFKLFIASGMILELGWGLEDQSTGHKLPACMWVIAFFFFLTLLSNQDFFFYFITFFLKGVKTVYVTTQLNSWWFKSQSRFKMADQKDVCTHLLLREQNIATICRTAIDRRLLEPTKKNTLSASVGDSPMVAWVGSGSLQQPGHPQQPP